LPAKPNPLFLLVNFVLVAMYYNNHDVRVEEVPKPEIGDDEFLFKVMACGICGSDVTEWYRVPKAPKVLGHEAVGVISEVGKTVVGYRVGDRVFVSHHVPCNKCSYCLRGHHTACETLHGSNYYPGGFSQFVRVPKINVECGVYRLPENMSYEEGTFIEPLACVVRGQRLSGLGRSDSLLIIGGGLAGLLHLQLAKVMGVENVVVADINPYRLGLAEKFGADYVLDSKQDLAKKLGKINCGRLADQVFVCTGATPAALAALECVDKGGKILFFAVPDPTVKIPVPITEFWRNEITILTSYGASPADLAESLAVLSAKKINVADMVTHRFGMLDVAKGFGLVASAGTSMKVIIEPNHL
jgi:L-iditol 2-dehydrogenase